MEASFTATQLFDTSLRPEQRLGSAIEIHGLGFNYKERRALDNLSFAIERGEVFGLLGPNGSGKTTLFKLLSTLVPLQSGEARILGYDLRADTSALRRRIGVVFQHPGIDLKLTVGENLMHHGHLFGLSGQYLQNRIATMLGWLGLSERVNDLAETLSGGLQRRVELAQAFLHRPELLILDEPSTGLDPVARREFLSYVARLRDEQGVTIVLTTHHMEEAERCDRLGILHEGKLVGMAPPSELKSEVGGDVVVITAKNTEMLKQQIQSRMRIAAVSVSGTLRIERPRGHEFVRDVVEAFGDQIESVT
ncbi:MAG TPA: ABC transporter ATP-binding protein, partial [Candidatus Binataceae bacterium]|nr:ABC transporter ATP-binding protein [Candidatus Binataceae bacterium]